ncbi:mannose-1-phosphate guanylyltransferase [Rickettsia endosymbiont of Halotydeus destructor]|uniref:mannose-1-phosphate guanylyltransferase n=1 Tax=Rickettsia endosymbiont of Halotydeus destructor TaxID=2996754 RepID=UPI003BB1A459
MKIKPVIMAGGQGTRLWPLSLSIKPKQFLKTSLELSSLQKTLIRNKSFGVPLVITGERYEFIAKEQAAEINAEIELITEPLAKNTAMCAVITALTAKNDGFDTVILLPSDHYISDEEKYLATINKALSYVEKWAICTIGIPIDRPNTEYGYIKAETIFAENIYQANHFIEKPSLEHIHNYIQSGGYFWNSGIFIYNIDFLLNQIQEFQPDLLDIAEKALNLAKKDKNITKLDLEIYNKAKAVSIDHAVIEHIPQMIMIKANFAWSDVGTWHSLWQTKQKDITDNYCEGNVVVSDTTNSYISSDNKLTTVVGLDNIIVINSKNGLLVADKSKAAEIKQLVMHMEEYRI